MKNIPVAIAVLLSLLCTLPAAAGGGFGTVVAEANAEDKITISWSEPSGKLRHASNPPKYEICYKEVKTWKGSCAHEKPIYTSSRPYPLTGLTPEKCYKIKVSTYTEKKNLFGKWKNPRYRKVSTVTQCTPKLNLTEPDGYIEFFDATASSATVRAYWSHPQLLERIVVCYKKTWYPWLDATLNPSCTRLEKPNSNYGWAEFREPATHFSPVLIKNLDPCRQYRFQAYAFYRGGGQVQFGKAIKGHTPGKCRISLFSLFIDSDDLLPLEYVHEVETFYDRTLPEQILEEYPQLRREHHLLQLSDEEVSESLIFLDYLMESHPDVVDAWQNEASLREAGLGLDQYLESRDPQLLRILQEDLAAEEVLSLNDDRFEVYVTWQTSDGGTGSGQPVRLTRDTGYFWFFDPENVELVVKVLNACEPFGRFWVFAAGLTDVAVEVTVVDTATGATFDFSNPQGQAFQPVQATDAFATCP